MWDCANTRMTRCSTVPATASSSKNSRVVFALPPFLGSPKETASANPTLKKLPRLRSYLEGTDITVRKKHKQRLMCRHQLAKRVTKQWKGSMLVQGKKRESETGVNKEVCSC